MFVPFTTIDNHKKCVTVVEGLLKNETTNSYVWLLKAFIKAFGKAPSIVVTDQDGAMRNAIQAEFVGLKDRLCMWHITLKLHAKNIYIDPEEFEYRWGKSESENSFFSHFTNLGSTLMNFMNCFETAMEKQRHVQERLDYKTIDTVLKLKTYLSIERHASNVYTRSLFELVQKEIFAGTWHCQIDTKSVIEGSEVSIIKENPFVYETTKKMKNPQSMNKGKDKDEEDDTGNLFFRKDGLFKVLRNVNANIKMIPQQYILRRWTKNLISATLRNKRNRYGEKNVIVKNFTNEATLILDHCVNLLSKDEPRLGAFVEKLKLLKKDVEADCPNPPSKNKTDNLEQVVRVAKPHVVDVNNSSVGTPKGCRKLRIKGGKEKTIEKSLKNRNSCSLCVGFKEKREDHIEICEID
ncbi:protein FAR1-related sequence 5 [Tanacetum coccineum]